MVRRDRTEGVLRDAPVAVTVCDATDPETPLVYTNDRFLELTGYDEAAVLGESYGLFDGPATVEAKMARVREALADPTEETVDIELHCADGTSFRTRMRITPVGDDRDRVGVFHEDITAERAHGSALQALNRFASQVQERETAEAVYEQTVRAAAEILDFDMCAVMVREGEWLVPQAMSDDAPPDGARRMELDQGLAGKTYQTGESQLAHDTTTDGESDPAKESYRSGISVPIGEDGVFQAVRTEVAAFDAADIELAELLASHTATALSRIEREAELEAQNDRLEAFADVVSHDLRNPLSVVEGSLTLASESDDPDEHIQRAQRSVDRMEQLIDGLLGHARSGDELNGQEPVALPALIETCWGNVVTGETALSIRTDRTVRAEESRLGQLVENLLRNAIEHGDAGEITVGDLPEGFYVSDDGTGIDPDERERVFESGFSTAEGGTGFGLMICDQVARAHGWEISVTESSAGGARFEITGVDVV